ncbi:hypothetical protein KX816_04520 [Sphingosinicellaceae bacterium]|nr:hypothetical protein KX816_04520 [Sphingosinicellaceae bacterium]
MELNIVIRTADPAGAAATLRALGLEISPPNRPNPTRWHGKARVSVLVEACGPGEQPSAVLGVEDPHRLRAAMTGQATTADADGPVVIDIGGLPVSVVADAGLVSRPGGDASILLHAEVILRDAAGELAEAFSRLDVRNARVVGPQLLLGRFERLFTMVVDGSDQGSLEVINAILAVHSDDTMRIEARAAEEFDGLTLARIDKFAWDVRV